MPKFLNDQDRQAIIEKIMADIPQRPPSEIIEEVQAKLVEAMSPECRAVYRTTPDALKGASIYNLCDIYHHYTLGNLKEDSVAVHEILKPYRQAYETRYAMQKKLTEMFKAVRTVASLHETYPDFKRYYPPVNMAEMAKRKKKDELSKEELEALLETKRKEEEKAALKTVQSFGVASELSQMGWTPAN